MHIRDTTSHLRLSPEALGSLPHHRPRTQSSQYSVAMDSGWTVATLFLFAVTAASLEYYDLDRGPFCGRRDERGQPTCCRDRQDSCNMTRGYGLMATECYCDEFCRDTHPGETPDCCPDYWAVCQGETPKSWYSTESPKNEPEYFMVIQSVDKEGCYYPATGAFYASGTEFYYNCNLCRCIDMGAHMEIDCYHSEQCIIDTRLIQEVNRAGRGWTAGNVTQFWGKELERDGYNRMLGTNYSSRKVRTMYAKRSNARVEDFPTRYDWRDYLGTAPIVNQDFCNASWSYAIVSTLSDRLLVSSKGRERGALSYQQHRNCVNLKKRMNNPCNPGHLTHRWGYVSNKGLVKEACYPSSPSLKCEITEGRLTNKIMAECPGTGTSGKLFRASYPSRVSGEAALMKEIQGAGPVLATMRVFHEFFLYQGGIYDCAHVNPKHGRLHSVKIVGWGEENVRIGRRYERVPYWIVANSWGTEWGENGYFRIRRGINACDIEEFNLSFYVNSKRVYKRSLRSKNPFLPA